MTLRVVHLATKDGLACNVMREQDSRTTTELAQVTCPFCKGKK